MAEGKEQPPAAKYRAYLQGEVDGAALYHAMADAEPDANRAEVLRRLAQTEERHAAHWQEKLAALGEPAPALRPGRSARLLGALARRFGAKSVLPIAHALELKDGNVYAAEPEAGNLAADERVHSHTVTALAGPSSAEAVTGRIMQRERWHRGRDGGGSLRAAIFGVNDGLVSNLSLVMGVAGADPGGRFVLLSGVAGLLAGAFSMAAGEYVSVTAQRELFERQLSLEQQELAIHPEEEQEELALIYQAKGIPAEQAEALAARIIQDKAVALDTLAREELGLNPDDLGSPWGAALSSFVMFAIGALLPVLPYLFTSGTAAVIISAALAGLGLATAGAAITLFTGRSPVRGALRMLLIGAGAAAVTYLVGRLIGVSVS